MEMNIAPKCGFACNRIKASIFQKTAEPNTKFLLVASGFKMRWEPAHRASQDVV
jgi:hypothetical protein